MDTNRMKKAAEWFYSNVFRDEAIRPRAPQSAERLPSLLRSARSLESGISGTWQSREALFVKQGKLLANYEDDYAYDGNVLRYYPTYQSLTDRELRAYFSWRTKLRRGEMRKTSLSFAFLYIYELINQIGVTDPMDGYRKLKEFQRRYGELDRGILPHLNTWLTDYVVYYGLSPELLADSPQVAFDRSLAVLADIKNHSSAQIMEAVRALSPRWLERSKFYKASQQDMDAVIPRVLRRVSEHCDARCKRSMVEQYFGPYTNSPARLFNAAVFFDRLKDRICEYAVDEVRIYRCKNGVWSVQKYVCSERSGPKLDALIKTIDSVMRECYGYRYGVRRELDNQVAAEAHSGGGRRLSGGKKGSRGQKSHHRLFGAFQNPPGCRRHPGQADCGGRAGRGRAGGRVPPGACAFSAPGACRCRGLSAEPDGIPAAAMPALRAGLRLGAGGGLYAVRSDRQHQRKTV